MKSSTLALASRYVSWLHRRWCADHRGRELARARASPRARSTFHLPLRADFSYLLPQDAPAVRDLRRLEARVQGAATRARRSSRRRDPATRAPRPRDARRRASAQLPPTLVERVDADDDASCARSSARTATCSCRSPISSAARDALAAQIAAGQARGESAVHRARRRRPAADAAADERARRAAREAARGRGPARSRSSYVSADGTIAARSSIRTAFRATDVERGAAADRRARRDRARGRARAHPGVDDRLRRRRRSPRSPSTARSSRGIVLSSLDHRAARRARARRSTSAARRCSCCSSARSSSRPRSSFGARGAHRRPPQRGDRVPRRDHRGQRRQLRHPADRALPRGAPRARRRRGDGARDRRHAAADAGRVARRGDRVRLARRDELPGFADFAVIGAIGMLRVLDRVVRRCCPR